jgi:hypothetical protein
MVVRAILGMALCASISMSAQQQVPNSDLDAWNLYEGSGTYKDYEEPSGGWTSGNGVIHVAPGADPVLEKTTDRISGDHAAKLTTRRIFGQIASGSLYTGKFQLNLGDPAKSAKRGIPFSARPLQFRFWYRYLPQGSDSATMYAILSRWNGTERQRIAEARLYRYEAQSEWTQASLTFSYVSDEIPDTIAVVFAASAGGEFFRGDIGTTLYVDNITMVYDPVSVNEDRSTSAPFSFDGSQLIVDPTVALSGIDIYSLQGACVAHFDHDAVINLDDVPSGIYAVVVRTLEWCRTWTVSLLR